MPGASSAICVGEPSSPYSGRGTGTANQNGAKSPAGAAGWPAAGAAAAPPRLASG
ncbi:MULTISPECIES: hypothetical protein [Streptomyces]|uniref:hypothetical protein n=1 Tax=Streptomyces TaxID=1883 RepID=UPI00345C59B4